MGTNNIPAATDSTIIPADHHNKIRTALIGDIVPRNSSANAEDEAGSVGQSGFRWLQGYIKTLFVGSVADNISLSSSSGDLIISVGGNVRAKFPEAHMFLPPAMVVPFAGSGDVGTEWLLCDGRELNRITYGRLFAVIGTTHGEGNATSTFNIPDYRGRFIRGTDNMGTAQGAAGRDPDAAARTAMNTNGNTANNVGSIQSDAMLTHSHLDPWGATTPSKPAAEAQPRYGIGATGLSSKKVSWEDGGFASTNAADTSSTGSSTENRPLNAYVNYLIKT